MIDGDALDWAKGDGLIPVIVQNEADGAVLMLGYMNAQALKVTQSSGRVTFFSRSRQRLWTKGETSGHFLEVKSIAADCDADTLLVLAAPHGPSCHLNTPTCWGEHAPATQASRLSFLVTLERVLEQRIATRPPGSYTTRLLAEGPRRMAQKVGEEGVELALAAVSQSNAEIVSEAADLMYHLMLLLKSKGIGLRQVTAELAARHDALS
jgi:phosphoribosyl-AMP cyclohydrolase / phosphoribosyl-ATP pyrophosphohydrolase